VTGRAADDGSADLDALAADAQDAGRRVAGLVAGVTFAVLQAIVGMLTVSLGLVAPPWAVVLMAALWVAIVVVGWRQRARRPIVTMLLPFVNVGIVLAVVALGDAWLGWTA
jgi:hypothetical protein